MLGDGFPFLYSQLQLLVKQAQQQQQQQQASMAGSKSSRAK
jgi:hypothetical protein